LSDPLSHLVNEETSSPDFKDDPESRLNVWWHFLLLRDREMAFKKNQNYSSKFLKGILTSFPSRSLERRALQEKKEKQTQAKQIQFPRVGIDKVAEFAKISL